MGVVHERGQRKWFLQEVHSRVHVGHRRISQGKLKDKSDPCAHQ